MFRMKMVQMKFRMKKVQMKFRMKFQLQFRMDFHL